MPIDLTKAKEAITRILDCHDIYFDSVRVYSTRRVTLDKVIKSTQLAKDRALKLVGEVAVLIPSDTSPVPAVKKVRNKLHILIEFILPSDMTELARSDNDDWRLIAEAFKTEEGKYQDATALEMLSMMKDLSIRKKSVALYKAGYSRKEITELLSHERGKPVLYQQVYQATENVIPGRRDG